MGVPAIFESVGTGEVMLGCGGCGLGFFADGAVEVALAGEIGGLLLARIGGVVGGTG